VTQVLARNNEVVNQFELLKSTLEVDTNIKNQLNISINSVIDRSKILWMIGGFWIINVCYTIISGPADSPNTSVTAPSNSDSQEMGTVWRCYKSVSGVYETLEYPRPRSNPDPSICNKVR